MTWRRALSSTGGEIDPEHEQELRLIAHTRVGAAWALSALVARYQPLVVRYLVRLTGDSAQAHKLAEAVFVRMSKRLRGPQGGDHLRLWLLRTSTDAGLDALRRPSGPSHRRLAAPAGPAALLAGKVGDTPVGRFVAAFGARVRPAAGTRAATRTQQFVWQAPAAGENESRLAGEDDDQERLSPQEIIRHRMMRVVLAELPYGDAQCLSLHLVAGLNQAEVAQALALALPVAQRRIVQGLQLFGARYDAALASLGISADFDAPTPELPRSEPMTVTAPAADSAEAASVAPAAAPALDLATDAAHAAPAYIAPVAAEPVAVAPVAAEPVMAAPAMHDPLVNAMPEPLAAPANEEAAGDLPASVLAVPVRASAPLSALAVGVDERAAAVEPLLPPIEESPAGEPAAASDEWLDVTPGDQTKATGADEYPGAVPISEDARGGELRAAHDTVVATPDLQMLQAPEAGEQLDHAAQRPDLLAERDTPGESPVSSDALDAAPPLSVLSTGEVPDSDNVESAAEARDVGHSAANAPAYPATDEVPPMLANDAPSLAHASALPPATAVATEEAAVFAARPPTNTTVPLEQAEQDPGAEELLAATPPEGALATPSASAPETLESDPTDVAATATPTPEPQAVDAPTIGLAAQSSAVLAAHPELSAGSGTEDDEFILVVEPEVHTPPRPRDTTMARSLKARRRRVLSADGEAEDPVESSGSWPAS